MAIPELPSPKFSQHSHFQPDGEGTGLGNLNVDGPDEIGQPFDSQDLGGPSNGSGNAGNLTGADNSRENLLSATPFPESAHPMNAILQFPHSAIKDARRAVWEATGEVPPIAGGAPEPPTETSPQAADDDDLDVDRHTIWPPRPADAGTLDLGLQRDRDLSPGANWLVERLLGGARDYGEELKYLQWRADKLGIDLQAAIDELNRHGLLVSRRPGWIDLPWK